MSEFNLPMPMKVKDDDEFLDLPPHDDPYDDDLNPNNVSPWLDPRDDGGGKLRLKRRRRCGQCGPCQVKENCGKCQYCVRKDVLKQACIYRKCIYLRKPVPRFRQVAGPDKPEASLSSPGSSSSLSLAQPGTSKDPSKPAPNVNICALGQSQLAAREALSRQMEQLSHLSDNGRPNSDDLMFRNSQPTMNPYRLSADQLNAISCAFPRPSWAHSGVNMNMAEAAAFHHNLGQPVLSRPSSVPSAGPTIPSPPSLSASSSCRLAMPDPACRYPVPSQPAFHPHMAFNTDWRSASSLTPSPAMGQSVTPPFYPPPHLPTSLPGFHGLNQFTSNSCPGSSFTGPRFPPSQAPMYPGSFYPPFRPPNEPHIYHAQFPGPEMAFSELNRDGMYFFPNGWTYDKKEDEDDLKKNSKSFPISKRMAEECRTIFEKYLKVHYSQPKVCLDSSKSVSDSMPEKLRMLSDSEESPRSVSPVPFIDEDLRRQLGSSKVHMDMDTLIQDLKMTPSVRSSHEFNCLDTDPDDPVKSGCDSDSPLYKKTSADPDRREQGTPDTAAEEETAAAEGSLGNRPGQAGGMLVTVSQSLENGDSVKVEVSGQCVTLEEVSIVTGDPLLQQFSDPKGLPAFLRSEAPLESEERQKELTEEKEELKKKAMGLTEKVEEEENEEEEEKVEGEEEEEEDLIS